MKELDYFINEIKKERNDEYNSIICANCCDLEEERVITKEEIKNYEQKYNIKIFETSAKSGLNVNEAFNYLIYLILKRKVNCFKFSLFKEPNCKNIFQKRYFCNINGNYIQLNIIDNNSYLDSDGLIFYFDVEYKDSFEYILNKINTIDDYYLNKNRTIIIYKAIKDKEDILINTKLDNLFNKKVINIFRILNEDDINITKLAIEINEDFICARINNKLNKYINF